MATIDTAVLLAAGRGSRLRPHTDTIPKPLLAYRNKPTLDYLLDSLALAGVKRVCLVVHYLAGQIETYAHQYSREHALQVVCTAQGSLFGTGHALQCVMQARPDWLAQPFLLSATDYIVPHDFYAEFLRFHRSHDADISISLKHLPESELSTRSSVRMGAGNEVLEIVEKPAPGTAPSNHGANLIYVLPPGIRQYIDELTVSKRGEREVQSAINACLRGHCTAKGLLQPTPLEWQAPDPDTG